MADRPELEPVAHAVMVDGRVHKLAVRADVADEWACAARETWPDADVEPLYTAAQVAKARAEERERMADMIERMTRLRRAARAALNDMPIQPCEFAAAIRQASEQANAEVAGFGRATED